MNREQLKVALDDAYARGYEHGKWWGLCCGILITCNVALMAWCAARGGR